MDCPGIENFMVTGLQLTASAMAWLSSYSLGCLLFWSCCSLCINNFKICISQILHAAHTFSLQWKWSTWWEIRFSGLWHCFSAL